jgi:hypothetical protein
MSEVPFHHYATEAYNTKHVDEASPKTVFEILDF